MKKLFFILLITAIWLPFSTKTSAQSLRFGFKAGIGVAKFNYKSDTAPDSLDFFEFYSGPRNTDNASFKPSYSVSGVVEYDVSKVLFLSSGLQANLKFSQFKVQSGYARDKNKYRFNVLYLQVPVTVHYRTGKFFLGAGGYGAWAVSGKWKNDVQNDGSIFQNLSGKLKFGNDPENSNLQRFDYGVRGEIGFGIKRLRLSLTFDQGLAKLKASNGQQKTPTNFSPLETGTLRNQAFYATATYYWLAK